MQSSERQLAAAMLTNAVGYACLVRRDERLALEFLRQSEGKNIALGHSTGTGIVELPSCNMASSSGADLQECDRGWTEVDKKREDKFYPRDFMYHDGADNQLLWLYALPTDAIGTCPYPLVGFAGGLYAVTVSVDQDNTDGERVYRAIAEWVRRTDSLAVDERQERPVLFHVITSDSASTKMRHR